MENNKTLNWWEDAKIISEVTAVMRDADVKFETTGGGTRHYVRDLFLSMLDDAGLKIVSKIPEAAHVEPAVETETEEWNLEALEAFNKHDPGINGGLGWADFKVGFIAGQKWRESPPSIQQEAIPQPYVENRACLFAAWLEDNALKDGEHWYLFTDHRKNRWDEIDEDCVKYTLPMLYGMFSNAIPDQPSNEGGETNEDAMVLAIRETTARLISEGPEACRKFLKDAGILQEEDEQPSPGQPEGEIPAEIHNAIRMAYDKGDTYDFDQFKAGAIAMYRHLHQHIMDGNDAYVLLEQQYEHLQETIAEVKKLINSHIQKHHQ